MTASYRSFYKLSPLRDPQIGNEALTFDASADNMRQVLILQEFICKKGPRRFLVRDAFDSDDYWITEFLREAPIDVDKES